MNHRGKHSIPLMLGLLLLAARVETSPATGAPDPETLSGGATTVFETGRNAFARSARNLSHEERGRFAVGNSFFNQNWVSAPASTTARDGLGPHLNAPSCSACHFKDGRAAPPTADDLTRVGLLLRVAVPEEGEAFGSAPHPQFGGQIQDRAISGAEPEAAIGMEWEKISGQYPDGTDFELERPSYFLKKPDGERLEEEWVLSPRIAPAVIGMGLLEAIPVSALRQHADPDDTDGDGISGRLPMRHDPESGQLRPGRFGWKSEAVSVAHQSANAFAEDMGLTNRLHPEPPEGAAHQAVAHLPNGGKPEVEDSLFDALVFYTSTLAVPARRKPDDPVVQAGAAHFREVGCAACHLPEVQTGDDHPITALRHQTIQPYTDLLLHDMGEALADHFGGDAEAGREWRTPPLWGIGLVESVNGHTRFLHDGRARNLEEAILWHGGEAEASRDAFQALSQEERAALLQFLQSL